MNGSVEAPDGRAPALELLSCSIGYGDSTIVRDVSLVVQPGEVVALLGSNGSGKTTLVRGALGLARIHGGSLHLFGSPLRDVADRARIGYVPQRHTVATAVPATVREVVAAGRLGRSGVLGRLRPSVRAASWTAVEDSIATVGLSDRSDFPLSDLSGGQQRRVLIARALAAQPELLFLDEPTAGVDAASQAALARTLAALAARGTTMVVVTHEVGALQDVVTRAVVMRDGRVARDGDLAAELPPSRDVAVDDHHHPADTTGAGLDWLPDPVAGD